MNYRVVEEISEHDQLVLMMAKYFQSLGYTDIRADLTGWTRPIAIWWTNNEDNKFYPDLTCKDKNGVLIILEAETCSTIKHQHTKDQFTIFRAHATNKGGRFEVVVPKTCSGEDGRSLIKQSASSWNISLDSVWTPS